jgi:hypothetical protein
VLNDAAEAPGELPWPNGRPLWAVAVRGASGGPCEGGGIDDRCQMSWNCNIPPTTADAGEREKEEREG